MAGPTHHRHHVFLAGFDPALTSSLSSTTTHKPACVEIGGPSNGGVHFVVLVHSLLLDTTSSPALCHNDTTF